MTTLDKITQYNEGTVWPLKYEDTYLATKHIQAHALEYDDDLINILKDKIAKAGLYFDDVDRLVKEIVAGLIKGNIILQGPPGTGKTSLSTIICESFNVDSEIITAVPDWTTYDTIGGLQPSVDDEGNEIIAGKDGRIVESIVKCCNTVLKKEHYDGENQALWLIIDELNRSETDKIFGDLFTVFGSGDLDKKKLHLWFENDDNKKTLYVPNRYRLIGLMNNVDKNFVNDLSHGMSRRFTFINVLPPDEKNMDKEIAKCHEIVERSVPNNLSRFGGQDIDNLFVQSILTDDLFVEMEKQIIEFLKKIRYHDETGEGLGLLFGTAQVLDLYENIVIRLILENYLSLGDGKESSLKAVVDDAINDRIIPQLDGCDYIKLKKYVDWLIQNKKYEWMQKSINTVKLMV